MEPTDDQLRISLAPLGSPHRSLALESVCDALKKTNTLFSGTRLQMHFVVAPPSSNKKRTNSRPTMSGALNVGRQLQDTETGYCRKVAIIRKKSCAAGRQRRYNLQTIRRLDSR